MPTLEPDNRKIPKIPPSRSSIQEKAASAHQSLPSGVADADFMQSNPALTNEGTTDGSGLKIEGLEAGRPYLQVRSYTSHMTLNFPIPSFHSPIVHIGMYRLERTSRSS